MSNDQSDKQARQSFHGPNLGYVRDYYDRFVQYPDSVYQSFRQWFERFGPPDAADRGELRESKHEESRSEQPQSLTPTVMDIPSIVAAVRLADSIRIYGHLEADCDPLAIEGRRKERRLNAEAFQVSEETLRTLPASLVTGQALEEVKSAWDAIERLRELYTQSIAYEFGHVHERDEQMWLREMVESGLMKRLASDERAELLNSLLRIEMFEGFLHRVFVGQKRFSVEGVDMLVPMLNTIIRELAMDGVRHVMMGMAHRGRLNVLAHVLGKPYGYIFSEFHHSPNKDQFPSEGSMGINYGWSGDVKYHLGANRALQDEGSEGGTHTHITLSHNPSHLEFVNPVVEGYTRAAQDDRQAAGYPVQDTKRAAMLLIHGDAAFPGEGVVSETLNFNKLRGYQNGGTIHLIVNNRIGFTTDQYDSRSTLYASDLAKGFEIPIVHVNADDVEACIAAVRLAVEYREKFKKDFVIDLIGYRRHGHNEMDDPAATQPLVYQRIVKHPRVSELYARQLIEAGIIEHEQLAAMQEEIHAELEQAYDEMKAEPIQKFISPPGMKLNGSHTSTETSHPAEVSAERLLRINRELLQVPEGFRIYPKLHRILKRRASALEQDGAVDWALAEALAFAVILEEGRPIRISGQDSERGTFAQRHLVLHDEQSGEKHCPLHGLPNARSSFAIYNSPLSEASVLGFEYGYDVMAPETLVIWEAQYGDFANAAQVIIDQFLAAGLAKWRQHSSLVLLLPHGYEGQGPEHSSARLERFLQLSAQGNWTVVNLTSAAQYYHLLRKQASTAGTPDARPLIVMAPKSLLRNPRTVSHVSELATGGFKAIYEEPSLLHLSAKADQSERIKRLILCSGKAALDLKQRLEEEADTDWGWLHIARVEQLYPFPESEILELMHRLPNLQEILWVQEEPCNMGAWSYMEPRLLDCIRTGQRVIYAGRGERSSPASGYADVHAYEQNQLLAEALNDKQV